MNILRFVLEIEKTDQIVPLVTYLLEKGVKDKNLIAYAVLLLNNPKTRPYIPAIVEIAVKYSANVNAYITIHGSYNSLPNVQAIYSYVRGQEDSPEKTTILEMLRQSAAVEFDANNPKGGFDPLQKSAINGKVDEVKRLLQVGVNPNHEFVYDKYDYHKIPIPHQGTALTIVSTLLANNETNDDTLVQNRVASIAAIQNWKIEAAKTQQAQNAQKDTARKEIDTKLAEECKKSLEKQQAAYTESRKRVQWSRRVKQLPALAKLLEHHDPKKPSFTHWRKTTAATTTAMR